MAKRRRHRSRDSVTSITDRRRRIVLGMPAPKGSIVKIRNHSERDEMWPECEYSPVLRSSLEERRGGVLIRGSGMSEAAR
jgi:hypothetical protein